VIHHEAVGVSIAACALATRIMSIETIAVREMLARLMPAVRRYAAGPDPRSGIAAKVALIVASNQPFYPLYLHAIAGTAAWPAWLTLITTPFFAAVPAVARRHSLSGRTLVTLAGIANTVLGVKLLGARSGVELFLLPCLLLAALLFHPSERRVSYPLMALPFLCYLVLDAHLGDALMQVSDSDYASLLTVNAISVASLIALIGLLATSITAET
jgi:hypothetical protein